jgi:hypothetical protein
MCNEGRLESQLFMPSIPRSLGLAIFAVGGFLMRSDSSCVQARPCHTSIASLVTRAFEHGDPKVFAAQGTAPC